MKSFRRLMQRIHITINQKYPIQTCFVMLASFVVIAGMAYFIEGLTVSKPENQASLKMVSTVYYAISVVGAVVTFIALVIRLRIRGGLKWRKPKRLAIDMCLPPDVAEEAAVSLSTAFDRWKTQHGLNKARRIYTLQMLGVISSFWINWLSKKLGLAKLIAKIF